MDVNTKFNDIKNTILKQVYKTYSLVRGYGSEDNDKLIAVYSSKFESKLESAIISYFRLNAECLTMAEITLFTSIYNEYMEKYDFQQELSDARLMPAPKKILVPKYRDKLIDKETGNGLGYVFTVPVDYVTDAPTSRIKTLKDIVGADDDESANPLNIHYPRSGPGFPPNTPPQKEGPSKSKKIKMISKAS